MVTQKSLGWRSWAELLLLASIWGGTFIAVGVAVAEVGVLTLVAFRVLGGAVLLWAFVLIRRYPIPKDPTIWAAFLIMGLLNNVIPFSLIAWGQLQIGAGLAAILNGSTAIFGVLVAAALFRDEHLSRRKALGVGIGFIGLVVAMGVANLTSIDPTSLAQIAVVGASISYALAGAWGRQRLSALSPQVAAAGMLSGSGITMAILAIAIDGVPDVTYTPKIWAALVYLALFSTAIAYLLYYRILEAAGSGNLLLVTLLIPPIAIVLGVVFLGETLRTNATAGLLILTLGLLIVDGRIFGLLPGQHRKR